MQGEINQFPAVSLQIGAVTVPNRVILAPMSGITDAPFRRWPNGSARVWWFRK